MMAEVKHIAQSGEVKDSVPHILQCVIQTKALSMGVTQNRQPFTYVAWVLRITTLHSNPTHA